jgi:BirA family transcriptional regulator, biotin operon repressor / biotin---[acetyl-CoA-carboxylase] ligase
MNWRIHRFPLLASTNDLALSCLRAGTARAGDVIVAAEQAAGRGRPGRSWHSPKGALLCTAVLPFLPERAGWAALAAGIAAARAARDLGAPAGVKWPNDVVLDGRKLAGILVETCVPDLAAVGIGMNVANPLPPEPELAARTARLADFLPPAGPESGVEAALRAALARLAGCWELLLAADLEPLRREWEALDTTAGRRVRWSEEGITGTAVGVDADGALLLRTEDERTIAARVGEVAFL